MCSYISEPDSGVKGAGMSSSTMRMRLLTGIAASAVFLASSNAMGMPMREAVAIAVDSNPEIGEAIANREAVEFELRQGAGLSLPSIDIEGRAGGVLRDSPSSRLRGDDDKVFLEREASVVLRQLLFDGFEARAEVERQASRVDGASFRVYERSEFIALAVIREYLDILRLRQVRGITQDNVVYHEGLAERIRLGTVGGTLSVADRQQAEERLFAARSRVSEAVEEVKAAEAAFVRLVGMPVGRVSQPAPIVQKLPPTFARAVGLARKNNPSVKIAQADLDAAYALVKAAESAFYPKLSFEARARAGRNLDGFEGQDNELRAGVVLSWNLYRGGIDRANRQEQIRRVDEEAMRLNRVSREVEEAVRLSWDRHQQQVERLSYLRRQETAADELVRSYSDQFAIGQRSLLDLLDAQNTRVSVRIAVETAAAAVRFAEYRILAATGTLLTTLGIQAPHQATAYAREQVKVPETPPAPIMPRESPSSGLGPLY